jgi:hypothetical protein
MKRTLIVVGVVVVIIAGVLAYLRIKAKSYSPEGNVDFSNDKVKIHIFYNRPYKKGRAIFGKLVPYGKTWRTGANEATQFETSTDLQFGDKTLKAGKYSLWTVPNEQTWQVVFNTEIPSWGIGYNGEAQRNTETDAVVVEVPVNHAQEKEFEQFTISIENAADGIELIFFWDKTIVSVPFSVK